MSRWLTALAVAASRAGGARRRPRHAATEADHGPRPRRVGRRLRLGPRHRQAAGATANTVARSGQPAARGASDAVYLATILGARAGPARARRPLLRRVGDHQRRHWQPERQGAGLRRRVHPGRGRRSRRLHLSQLPAGQLGPGDARLAPFPPRGRHGPRSGATSSPGVVPPSLRRRPSRPLTRGDGHRPAAGRARRRSGASGPPAWKTIPS